MRLEWRYLIWGKWVGDTGRDVIRTGQNSDTESVEDGISDMMGMGENGSRVGPEVQS